MAVMLRQSNNSAWYGLIFRPLRVVFFLLRVEFGSRSIKKSEFRVEYRVTIAVVDSVILDVIIISDITVILSRLDWIIK